MVSERSAAAQVLAVDDRIEMADMIAEDLGTRGYQAVAVSSGQEALARLKSDRVDALVTDLRMPDVDGLQLLRVSRFLDPTRVGAKSKCRVPAK